MDILATLQNPLIILASLKEQKAYDVLSAAGNLLYHTCLHTFPYAVTKSTLTESSYLFCAFTPLDSGNHILHDSKVKNQILSCIHLCISAE
jgi:hypothetical protein